MLSSTSSSIAPSLGLTQPRKRATPILESLPSPKPATTKSDLLSPESAYSARVEEEEEGETEGGGTHDIIDAYSESGEGDWSEGGSKGGKDGGIRMVDPEEREEEDGEEKELRAPNLSRTPNISRAETVQSVDRPYLGRSISYRQPLNAVPTPLPFYHLSLPSFISSLPLHLQPTLPYPTATAQTPARSQSMTSSHSSASSSSMNRSISSGSGSTSSGYSSKSSSSSFKSTAKLYVTKLLRSSSMDKSSSSDSQQSISSTRYTDKFPDRWMSLNREKKRLQGDGNGEGEGLDLGVLWEQAGRRGGAGLEEEEGGAWSERRSWTREKWCLLAGVFMLFTYGMTGVICALLTWLRTWPQADVVLVANAPVILYLTLASIFCLLTSLIGLIGTLLESRPILSLYAVLLWPCGLMLLAIGYSAYKKEALSLDLKLNQAWSIHLEPRPRSYSDHPLRYPSPFISHPQDAIARPTVTSVGTLSSIFYVINGRIPSVNEQNGVTSSGELDLAKPTVVFVHGSTSSHRTFAPQVRPVP
ncbi:hypothetical protein P7C70_g6274, partial [Phenoliferia sp. Uapishka_3]